MRTLLDADNVSVHIFHDDADAVLVSSGFYFDGSLVDPGITSDNASIVDCGEVIPPAWYGRKYVFVDNEWSLNPNNPALT
jgi:hypothetical protein